MTRRRRFLVARLAWFVYTLAVIVALAVIAYSQRDLLAVILLALIAATASFVDLTNDLYKKERLAGRTMTIDVEVDASRARAALDDLAARARATRDEIAETLDAADEARS